MDLSIFTLIGALGLVIISIGILIKKEETQDISFIIGGVCLEIYSIYIQNVIFIILQLVFIASATYELINLKWKK